MKNAEKLVHDIRAIDYCTGNAIMSGCPVKKNKFFFLLHF